MNREQAEHILDAYVWMRMRESDKDASDALREVILDAMTEYRVKSNYPSITYTNDATMLPTTPKATFTGIDPVFDISTTAVVSE